MQVINFTEEVIKTLATGTYKDGNLYLKVRDTGKKSFFQVLKHNNSKKVIKATSLLEARKKAQEGLEFESLLQLLKRVKKYQTNVLMSDAKSITTKWKIFDVKNCMHLKDILKTDIYAKDFEVTVLKQLKLIEKFRGKMACITTFQDLHLLLKFAKQRKLVSVEPDLQVIRQDMPQKSKRDAYIKTKEQMKSFVDACYASPHGDIFMIALLTCSRIGDIIDMRWSDINWQEQKWSYFPQKQKAGDKEEVHVPLSDEVVRLLKKRNTSTIKVFDGYYHRDVLRKWNKIKQNITKDMKDLHIHDLRRTHLHWSNIQDYLIAQHSLGHKVTKSAAAIYLSNAATFEQRLGLVQDLEKKILNTNLNKTNTAHQT